jgi:ectoine hydroxylase-related dioxygenase (phytanoyl-CoA dioxygenase family)
MYPLSVCLSVCMYVWVAPDDNASAAESGYMLGWMFNRHKAKGSRMNTFEQKITELRVFGFTVVTDVLSADEVAEMRDFVAVTANRIGVLSRHRGTALHLANLINLHPMFFKMIDHERVLPYIEAIMSPDLILGSLNARIIRPGDGKQILHSDVPLPLHRYGQESPVMMNTLWPLHDYTLDNGATFIVPGSHQSHMQEPPPGFDPIHQQQPLVRAGSVLIINGQTWHGGGENRSTADRIALFGHYRYGQWMRFQCDPHDQFSHDWHALLTERQQQLLRMTHGVDGRHGADFYER